MELFKEMPLKIQTYLEIRQSRDQLSEEIGFSVKTLNRNIKKLQEDHLIQLDKGKILVTEEGYLHMKRQIGDYIYGEI